MTTAAIQEDPIGREAGEDLEDARRVKINSEDEFVYADAGELHHGVTLGSADEERRALARSRNATGIVRVTVDGSVSALDDLYGAADGKVSDTEDGAPQFIALQDASGDGEIIEALPCEALSDAPLRTVQLLITEATADSDFEQYLLAAPTRVQIESVKLVSDTAADSADGSNNWEFQVQNLTDSEALVSAPLNTDDDDVINTADEAYALGVDQNNVLETDDVLELQATATGTPEDLSSAVILASVTMRVLD